MPAVTASSASAAAAAAAVLEGNQQQAQAALQQKLLDASPDTLQQQESLSIRYRGWRAMRSGSPAAVG